MSSSDAVGRIMAHVKPLFSVPQRSAGRARGKAHPGAFETVGSTAREVLRVMAVRLPQGALKHGEACRGAIAVDIALRKCRTTMAQATTHDHTHFQKRIVHVCGATAPQYKSALQRVENIIGVRELSFVSLHELGVTFGGLHDIVPKVRVRVRV